MKTLKLILLLKLLKKIQHTKKVILSHQLKKDLSKVISDIGFGKNEYVETSRPIVIVTAPGPGSGKMAVCMSQLYNELKHGIKAGYAKYETFPIWNLGLEHPVNLAYESATADLNDENMVDIYHEIAYGKRTTNYNRDIQAFPIVREMLTRIYGKSPYNSPTDMGVNMAGFAIVDSEASHEASKNEIVRRYYQAKVDLRNGKGTQQAVDKILLLLNELELTPADRKCVKPALDKKELTGTECMALELPDGSIVTAKTSNLLLAPAALLLNALKK
ncbi:MAG: DUF1846 family protein, partial [Bacilli bacterium]|nr:DUF1846 family protein [Bacilli bacterium]